MRETSGKKGYRGRTGGYLSGRTGKKYYVFPGSRKKVLFLMAVAVRGGKNLGIKKRITLAASLNCRDIFPLLVFSLTLFVIYAYTCRLVDNY